MKNFCYPNLAAETGSVDVHPSRSNSDLDEKYGPVRLLTSADDLNNITNNGTYWYWTDSVPANAPYNNAAIVEVSGSTSDTTQKIQRATRYGVSGQSAFRALDTAGWKEWAAYLTNADLVLEEKSKAYTIGQGDNNIDISVAKEGYTPIAVAGINGFGDTTNVRQFMLSGTTLRITANRSVSTSTSGTANVKILYVRK